MPDTPTTTLSLLAEALDLLEARGVEIILEPVAGVWRMRVKDKIVSTGELVAIGVALGMLGQGTALQ